MNLIINNTQADILELLARFKFLVISQMQPLLDKSLGYVRQQLASLAAHGLIKSYQLDKPGKAENMYYLTEAGKDVILSNSKAFAGDIKLPVGVPLIVRDYGHRKHMIDVHVSLYYHLTSAGISVKEFLCYFDKAGENRRSGTLEAKTKISLGDAGFFIPDGIMLTQHGSDATLHLIEMYCDDARSTARVMEQLRKHMLAISLGTPAKKFGLIQNPFVLSAFQYPAIQSKIVHKLKSEKDFEAFAHLFFFASLDEIKKDGLSAWKTVDAVPIEFTR